jgi:nucleoside-diphosphate-sugar epimerase
MDPREEARGEAEREAPVRTMERALVTGATGCLGRHLVEALVERGTYVRALARESSRTDHLKDMGIEIQRGTLVDEEDLERAVASIDTVFHLGGLVRDDPDDTSDELWQELRRVNVEGSERLARLAATAGAERFVFASSLRMSGFGNQILWPEDGAQTNGDLYARSKALAEDALMAVGRDTGLEVVCIRPRFIYGNHDRYVLPQLVESLERRVVPVASNETICDIVYVGDCVQALLLAAERPVGGRSYNVTSGECLSLREILSEIGRALGKTPRFVPVPPAVLFGAAGGSELVARALGRRPGLTRARVQWLMNDHHFSIARARDELGYQPRYRLRDGLAEVDLRQFVSNGRI